MSLVYQQYLNEAEWRTYVSVQYTNIVPDNGLSPGRRLAIIWTNAGIVLIGPLRTNFSDIWIEILKFSFKKNQKFVCEAVANLPRPLWDIAALARCFLLFNSQISHKRFMPRVDVMYAEFEDMIDGIGSNLTSHSH